MTHEFPVDAVITWVDGDDPVHKQKREQYSESKTQDISESATTPTRFRSAGEIDYCIRSILNFTPWVRRIYIVTDQQIPVFVRNLNGTPYEDRVRVIDHRTIFNGFDIYLPTFNTRTIAMMLWRIPNLSERFIFFNDDIFLTSQMKPSDFFTEDGKVVLRGSWKISLKYHLRYLIQKAWRSTDNIRPKHSTSHFIASRAAGFNTRFFYTNHSPQSFLRSSWSAFFDQQPDMVKKQLGYRFRHVQQFNVDSLSAHINIKSNNAVIRKDIPTTILHPESQTDTEISRALSNVQKKPKKQFICLQSLDNAPQEQQERILQRLNEIIPEL